MLTVNLLVWRPRLLYRRMRLSLLLSGIVLLGIGGAAAILRGHYQQQRMWWTQQIEWVVLQPPRYEQLYLQTFAAWQQRETRLAQQAAQEQSRRRNQRYQILLEQLPIVLPDSLWLTEISDDGSRIHVSGVSNHYSAVVALTNVMAVLPHIADADVQQTERDPQNRARLNFSLRFYWQDVAESGEKA
ncbi:Fimbrial assembly family protein [Dickeya chrysanthemi Ech1591]|uniref:Fimbrial assembly family protein n=1 Tax=Dickeya chrysanthemi (strain Ech1591) TaxID=561229 RepID=C6CH36_DICC1|nr:PilN domain-containing protein [Dickeya chrysanthemi]ACT05148.1 Fimbrial assembly family protein [Dickeya chrysanthemi Ech1591]WJM85178.1 PilN domain-containing protein [Dickeya chrysanthemi]